MYLKGPVERLVCVRVFMFGTHAHTYARTTLGTRAAGLASHSQFAAFWSSVMTNIPDEGKLKDRKDGMGVGTDGGI